LHDTKPRHTPNVTQTATGGPPLGSFQVCTTIQTKALIAGRCTGTSRTFSTYMTCTRYAITELPVLLLHATKPRHAPQLTQTRAQPQSHCDSDNTTASRRTSNLSNDDRKAGRDHGDDSDSETSSDSDSEASSDAACLQELHGAPLADILRYVDMQELRSFVEAGLVRIDTEKVYVNFDEARSAARPRDRPSQGGGETGSTRAQRRPPGHSSLPQCAVPLVQKVPWTSPQGSRLAKSGSTTSSSYTAVPKVAFKSDILAALARDHP
jgi:hypothetical protein